MARLTIRKLPEATHRALRTRAARNGNSMEAEVRKILEAPLSPPGQVKLGSLLADIGRKAKLSDKEFAVFEQVRGKTAAHPVGFE